MARRTLWGWVALLLMLAACDRIAGLMGGGDDTPPPPPPPPPEEQHSVTVVANSIPAGATVTGGGQVLGVTPLQKQVPIPAPQPGQPPPQFEFTFTLAGYDATTLQASPTNNVISVTATLSPVGQTPQVGTDNGQGGQGDQGEQGEQGGDTTPAAEGELVIESTGGGPIRDMGTASARAEVTQSCLIDTGEITLRGRHSYYGDLIVSLSGPDGISATLHRRGRANPFRTHTLRRVAGKQAQGEYRVTIRDTLREDSGTFGGFVLRFKCKPPG